MASINNNDYSSSRTYSQGAPESPHLHASGNSVSETNSIAIQTFGAMADQNDIFSGDLESQGEVESSDDSVSDTQSASASEDDDVKESLEESLVEAITRGYFFHPFEEIENILERDINKLKRVRDADKVVLLKNIQSLALICRFSSRHFLEVMEIYNPRNMHLGYFNAQINLARDNKIRALAPSNSMSTTDKLKWWASECYKQKRIEGHAEAEEYCAMRVNEKKALITPINDDSRYCEAIKLVPEFSRELVILQPTIEVQKGKITLEDDESYALRYPDPNNPQEYLQLTTRAKKVKFKNTLCAGWVHTNYRNLPSLLTHLDSLSIELHGIGEVMLSSQSEIEHEELKANFINHLAHVYWLAANIMITCRGSAQYCLNLLYHELMTHKLPPLIPKVGCIPDCVAISTPLEVFQRHFLSLFESVETYKKICEILSASPSR